MTNQLYILETKIGKIKKELIALGDLRPGSLSKQHNICGNPKCRCKKEASYRHGPYCQLSYTVMLQSELDISRNFVNLYNFGRKCYENEPQEIFG